MSKEQQELLDDAYNRYRATIIKEFYEDTKELRKWATVEGPGGHTKEEFIEEIKTDDDFSEKWGLKIEERELSLEERYQIAIPIWKEKYGPLANIMVPTNVDNTPYNIPTKLITITYKDTIIESYE
jgi:hypothetical protein